MDEVCGCTPIASKEERARMDRWLKGEEVKGFPKHDNTPFVGHRADEDWVPTDWESLKAYRKGKRLKPT